MGKLTKEQQKEILKLYRTGKFTQEELAERYGVSQVTVSYLVIDNITPNRRRRLETKVRQRKHQK